MRPTSEDLARDLAADLERADRTGFASCDDMRRDVVLLAGAAVRRALAAEEKVARLEGNARATIAAIGGDRAGEAVDPVFALAVMATAWREEADRLRAAIRRHRDQRGDDRCWLDDEELYRALPEGHTPPARDCAVELALCEKFIASRHNPATEYVSPQRRIEELESDLAAAVREIVGLRAKLSAAYERIAKQSDALARAAERRGES